MRYLVIFAAASTVWAGVDGTVVNRTTDKPQAGATVTLFKLTQAGPEALASTKSDAQGRFQFKQDLQMGGPSLVQAAYKDVVYNRLLPPGSPSSGVEVPVYESSSKPGTARVSDHMLLLEPGGQQMNVSETFIFRNDGKVTYDDPKNGTLRFFLPEAANGKMRINATEPHGMPIERAADKTTQRDIYKLDFPIKPGETRVDVAYTVPLSAPATFSGRTLYKDVPTRLAVPNGVTLEGRGLESLGQVPQTQASVYGVAGSEFTVQIKGTGSMQADADTGGDDSGPTISEILPRAYDNLALILAPALLVLAFGFVLLYRKGSAPAVRK